MKKRTLLVLMATALIATSCNNDTEEFEISSQKDAYTTFVAENPGVGDATRTEINYEGNVIDPWWSKKDVMFFCQELKKGNVPNEYAWTQSNDRTSNGKIAHFVFDDVPKLGDSRFPYLHEMMENIIAGENIWTFGYIYPVKGAELATNKSCFKISIDNVIANLKDVVIPGGAEKTIPVGTKLEKDFLIAKPILKENITKVEGKLNDYSVLLQFKRITSYLRLQFAGFEKGTEFSNIKLSTMPIGTNDVTKYNFKGQLVCDMSNSDITYANYGPMVLDKNTFNAADGYLIPIMPGKLKAGSKLYVELVDQNGNSHNKEININNDVFLQSGVITTFNITKP